MSDLDQCFESAAIRYQRWDVVSSGRGARFARQTNTSASSYTDETELRVWTVSARLARQAQFEALETAWAESKGGIYAATWTPPDESTAIAVLIREYRVVYAAHGRFEIECVLEEDL